MSADQPTHPPVACGALGAYDLARLEAVARALEASTPAPAVGVREVHRDEASALWLDREPERWGQGERRGLAWAESHPGLERTPRDRRDAALLGGLGVELDGPRRLVHTSVSGVGPVYWIAAGDATYFCSRVEPLLEAVDGPLSADLETWACILTLGYHPGERSPFEEIRRVPEWATLEHVPGAGPRVESETWPWTEVEPDGTPHDEVAAPILAKLRGELARLPEEPRPLRVPLSGGWDSRMLTILGAELRGPDAVSAFTINPDKGSDKEERFAAAVASTVGVSHRLVEPDPTGFRGAIEFALAAQEHHVPLHLPLARLALEIPPGPEPILEGVAGDIFIKAVYVTEPMAAAETWDDVVGGAWRYFVRDKPGEELFGDRWAGLAATGRAALDREAERFRGHPSAATLVYFVTRTRRATAVAPIDLFGRCGPVSMPFLRHEIVTQGLRVPLAEKLDGDLYRELLRQTGSPAALLPSTNDKDHNIHVAETARTRNAPVALEAYTGLLAEHPAPELFGPDLAERLARGRVKRFARGGGRLRGLYSLIAFGSWLRRHQARVRPVDFDALR